jgi:AcrR family transcriptional regulator
MKDSQPNNAIKQNRGRAETERRLIEVALELIQKNGVLAGLNLRQVAEGAGVNRGNIYHYFGSRQDLLRAAINRRFNAFVNAYTKSKTEAGFVARRLRAFASNASNDSNDSMLRALLVLDGDDAVDPMPLYEGQLSQVALSSFLRGYRIFRLPYAKRVGIKPNELDDRVSRILCTWLEAMKQPPKDS